MSARLTAINEDGSFKYEKTNKFIDNKINTVKQRIEETNNSTISPDGSFTINTDYAVNVVSGDVDPVDGFIEGTGQGTLLYVNRYASKITWPGGTVIHGRPGYLTTESFAAIARIGDTVHVVWSAVDQTPPPLADGVGGGGVIQMTLDDLLKGDARIPPGASVVNADQEESPWMFTNICGWATSQLTLTEGVLTFRLNSVVNEESVAAIYFYWQVAPFGALRMTLTMYHSTPITTLADGSGFVVASIPKDPYGEPYEDKVVNTWISLLSLFDESIKHVAADPSNPSGEQWMILVFDEDTRQNGLSVHEDKIEYSHENPGSMFGSTFMGSFPDSTQEDVDAAGITFPGTILTPEQVSERLSAVGYE